VVKNILYDDIRVEDSRGWLIDFKILKSRYSKDLVRGKIENITLRNIKVEGDIFPYSQIMGFDESNKVKNVTIEDFYIHGVKANGTYNSIMTTIHTENLIFK